MAASDEVRATQLKDALPWGELMQQIRSALRKSLLRGEVRFGFDESSKNRAHLRAVLQFHIGEQLFDWFFNACTGYRAQFRLGYEKGVTENSNLIAILREEVRECVQGRVLVRRLAESFEDVGPMTVSAHDLMHSLDPALSKLWFCERLIWPEGGVRNLKVYKTGPKLVFETGCASWPSIYADERNAWLDLKGAFVGDDQIYQLKDPSMRARNLQADGTA